MANMALLATTILSALVLLVAVEAELSLTPNELVCNANSPADEGYISFCHGVITCPDTCPKCQLSCKYCGMKECARCGSVGSVCEDPKFVGGDGVMFYFHGRKDKDFCIVSDKNLHINAHFIGKRTPGRPRDFTWVQSLSFSWGTHRLYVGARRTTTWSPAVDHLVVYLDGRAVQLPPFTVDSTAAWRAELDEADQHPALIARTAPANTIRLHIPGLLAVSIAAVPVTPEDSRIHRYEIGPDDCFAHLEIAFDFLHVSQHVAGVLGQTYAPGFVNPVKRGVPMPVLGGEHYYSTSSIFATDCLVSRFNPSRKISHTLNETSLLSSFMDHNVHCGSDGGSGAGFVCRK